MPAPTTGDAPAAEIAAHGDEYLVEVEDPGKPGDKRVARGVFVLNPTTTTTTIASKGAKATTTPTVTTVASVVLAANAARKVALFANPSTSLTVYLGISTVSATVYTVPIPPGNVFVDGDSSDAWSAITASGSVALTITEVS